MDEIGEIKQRLGVAEVVGSYVQLKQSGRNLKGVCPFHNEKTASFMVSPEKDIWHCFGCNEGGDIFGFVMKMEGLEFRGALETLAKRAGVELKESPRKQGEAKLKDRLRLAVAWSAKYYQAVLERTPEAAEYISQRGISKETSKAFMLGYAPSGGHALADFLIKKGFTPPELKQSGVVFSQGSNYKDMFRGRIIFPICDERGRPVGMTARLLSGSNGPKYINTPASPIYDKSRVLYGLHLAKEAIKTEGSAVIVEGNMDVISSHQVGVKNVVASSGTALTGDQIKMLSRLTKQIKLAFDQDGAGLSATERAIELAAKAGISVDVVSVPGAKDPDELIAKSPADWQKAISASRYALDWFFDYYAGQVNLDSAFGKRVFSDRLSPILKNISDPVEQDHYVQLLAERSNTGAEAIKAKIDEAPTTLHTNVRSAHWQSKPKPTSRENKVEEELLALALVYPSARGALTDLSVVDMQDPARQSVLSGLKSQPKITWQKLADSLKDNGDYVKILALRAEETYNNQSAIDLDMEAYNLARSVADYALRRRRQEVTSRLSVAEKSGDAQAAKRLREEYQALNGPSNK